MGEWKVDAVGLMYPVNMLSSIPAARFEQIRRLRKARMITRKEMFTLMGWEPRWAVRMGKLWLAENPNAIWFSWEKTERHLYSTKEAAQEALREYTKPFMWLDKRVFYRVY